MRILIPVVDAVNFMPAVRHVIHDFLSGERMEVHLLYVRSPFRQAVAAYFTGRSPDAFRRRAADKALQPACALLARVHIPYTVHIEAGDKAKVIGLVARRLGIHRIVLGTARNWSATRLTEESTIEKVLASAPVPVSVIPGRAVSRVERYGVAAGLGATLWLILFG
jgi:nucleotide-binding universal stress UspA family protein